MADNDAMSQPATSRGTSSTDRTDTITEGINVLTEGDGTGKQARVGSVAVLRVRE